ncbi:MAG: AraC family ligand binding domain-containing protein, partial [Hungatella sp.]
MNYTRTRLREELRITQIITIHYYEYMSDFMFEGESHDFWEFLCVDKGELEVTANQEKTILKKGDIIFHKPNEFHALA